MKIQERKELLYILIQDYLYHKDWDKGWQKEASPSHMIALGKLQGVCMALNLDFKETEKEFIVYIKDKRKVIIKVEKWYQMWVLCKVRKTMRKVRFISDIYITDYQECDDELYNKLKGLDKVKMVLKLGEDEFESLCKFEFQE